MDTLEIKKEPAKKTEASKASPTGGGWRGPQFGKHLQAGVHWKHLYHFVNTILLNDASTKKIDKLLLTDQLKPVSVSIEGKQCWLFY